MIPVSADSWKNYHYDGSVSRYEAGNDYIIDFSVAYKIVNPDKIKTLEFENMLQALPDVLSRYLNDSKLTDLNNQSDYEKNIISESNRVLTDIKNEAIQFNINRIIYSVLESSAPISSLDSALDDTSIDNIELEPATISDVEILLNAFKKDGYEKLSVSDYRKQIANEIDTNNDLANIIDRVRYALAENKDIVHELTKTQYDFLAYTLNASLSENYVGGAQQYTTEHLLPNIRIQQYLDNPKYYLDYRIYYEMSNEEKITVETRDRYIYDIIAKIQKYVEDSKNDQISDIAFTNKCNEIANTTSNADITFTIKSAYCIPQ